MTPRADAADAWEVPELGPSLGRLSDPPGLGPRGALGAGLDDIRLGLVTGIFELAGASRSFAGAGDPDGAMASLSRVVWLDLWEQAVASAADRVAGAANARLKAAAEESRFPPVRLRELLLTPEDTRAIAARLGSGGAPLVAALDALEQTVHAGSGEHRHGTAAFRDWRAALTAAARRLESAWLALEAAAVTEQDRWHREVERVRAWRRPRWPLWAITLLLLAATGYLGLMLGGYLPVPRLLQGLAAFWWSRL